MPLKETLLLWVIVQWHFSSQLCFTILGCQQTCGEQRLCLLHCCSSDISSSLSLHYFVLVWFGFLNFFLFFPTDHSKPKALKLAEGREKNLPEKCPRWSGVVTCVQRVLRTRGGSELPCSTQKALQMWVGVKAWEKLLNKASLWSCAILNIKLCWSVRARLLCVSREPSAESPSSPWAMRPKTVWLRPKTLCICVLF